MHSTQPWDWRRLERLARSEIRRTLGGAAALRADVEDVLQNTLTRAWCSRRSCRTPQAPEAWVAQIARNEARRHWAQAGARAARQAALRFSAGPGPGAKPIARSVPALASGWVRSSSAVSGPRESWATTSPERWSS